MIDPLLEDLITPAEATNLYPRRRGGRKVHVSRVYRDMHHGIRGVCLEHLRTPRLATSRQAVARFFRRLSEPTTPPGPSRSVRPNPARAARDLERELDRLGI
jgi:hypothetical protein